MKRDCPLTAGSQVWAYFRDSGGEAQERSVGQQLEAAREYAARHGLCLSLTFADEAKPGSTTIGRDALQDMLAKARQLAPSARERHTDAPDGILFWDTRRLGREQLDNVFIKADLRRRGYSLIFLTDDIPDAGDFAPVIEAFLDWKAEQDLKDIGKDAQRGLHTLAKNGYHPGGLPPKGYKVERVQAGAKRNGEPRFASRWVVDPATAPRVRLAWQMRAAGASYEDIQEATRLFAARNSWVGFFRNKTYLGMIKCGDLEIPDGHEPLCTPEQWEAVQRSSAPRRRSKPWSATTTYLLSGLVECGYCGSACSGSADNRSSRPNEWRYYVCGKRKRHRWDSCELKKADADRLEKAVVDQVSEHVLTPDFLRWMLDQVRASFSAEELDKQIAEKQAQVSQLDRTISSLVDAIETAPAAALARRLAEREQERQLLLAEVAALEAKRSYYQSIQIDDATLAILVGELRRGLLGDPATVRETLGRVVKKVVLKNDGGTLHITLPRQSFLGVPPRELESLSQTLTWQELGRGAFGPRVNRVPASSACLLGPNRAGA